MMIKTNYQISGLTNPATYMTIAGSLYFQRNLSVQNYELRSAIIADDVMRLTFIPDETLPDNLRKGEHYIEFRPQRDIMVVVKTILDQGDRRHIFYRVVDCVERKGKCVFRVRKYAMHTDDKYDNIGIKYRAGETEIPEENFRLIATQYSGYNDEVRVYERTSENL